MTVSDVHTEFMHRPVSGRADLIGGYKNLDRLATTLRSTFFETPPPSSGPSVTRTQNQKLDIY